MSASSLYKSHSMAQRTQEEYYYPSPYDTILGILEDVVLVEKSAILMMRCRGERLEVVVPAGVAPVQELVGQEVAIIRLEGENMSRSCESCHWRHVGLCDEQFACSSWKPHKVHHRSKRVKASIRRTDF